MLALRKGNNDNSEVNLHFHKHVSSKKNVNVTFQNSTDKNRLGREGRKEKNGKKGRKIDVKFNR